MRRSILFQPMEKRATIGAAIGLAAGIAAMGLIEDINPAKLMEKYRQTESEIIKTRELQRSSHIKISERIKVCDEPRCIAFVQGEHAIVDANASETVGRLEAQKIRTANQMTPLAGIPTIAALLGVILGGLSSIRKTMREIMEITEGENHA